MLAWDQLVACSAWAHRGARGNNAIPYAPSGMVARLMPFPPFFAWCVRGHTSCADQPDGTCKR